MCNIALLISWLISLMFACNSFQVIYCLFNISFKVMNLVILPLLLCQNNSELNYINLSDIFTFL